MSIDHFGHHSGRGERSGGFSGTKCFVFAARWVAAKSLEASAEDIANVADIVSTIMHTLDDEWLELATRPTFNEMLYSLEMVYSSDE